MSFSCDSREEHQLVKYVKANLPIPLKRRAECLSSEIVPNEDGLSIIVNVEFLLGLMEKSRVIYGISHLLFLTMKKFQKVCVEVDGNRVPLEITDERLKKMINKIYDGLKEEKG